MTVLSNRWNRVRYSLYAPIYEIVAQPLERGRKRAIDRLDPQPEDNVLIVGCGTGMDLAYLPSKTSVTAFDLTPTMVRRTAARAAGRDGDLHVGMGDAHRLPFDDDSFDAVLLHLVLSVVPNPEDVVREAARVLAPDGRVSIYDKFSPEGETPSLLRRMANPVARALFADLNRPLEPMLSDTDLQIGTREQFLGGLYTVTIARPTSSDADV